VVECVFGVAGYCLVPSAGQGIVGIPAVAVDIDIVAGTFFGHHITPLVGVHGMIAKELYVWFIEDHHLRRQEEHRLVIDFLVGIKAPAKARSGK
jgi:hypothetical protein